MPHDRIEILADLHTHTVHSHGRGTVEENVLAARARGLKAVGITDHGPASLFGVGVRDLSVYDEISHETKECTLKYQDIEVLTGAEANIVSLGGDLDVPDEVLSRLDVVLAGLHVMISGNTLSDTWALACRNFIARYSAIIRRRARVENTKALVEAVMRHPIDVVTHPGLHVSIDTEELALACARAGTALEINGGHPHMEEAFIHVARKQGVDFCISSDAHEPARVGDFGRAIELAERAGLDAARIVNASGYRQTRGSSGGVTGGGKRPHNNHGFIWGR
ncbi:MAG TPA: PHP domain-containing protein [Firmicutes bacterium]|nr:PHP domain-containing protein [Bacillota bacterium]